MALIHDVCFRGLKGNQSVGLVERKNEVCLGVSAKVIGLAEGEIIGFR